MPKHAKHGKGRLTIHLDELVGRANLIRESDPPIEDQLEELIRTVLIDYSAYAGMNGEGFVIHKRLTEPLD